MKSRRCLSLPLLSLTVVGLFCAALGRAENPPGFRELAIGDPAPEFSLPGIDGKSYALSDFSAADVLMVYFTSNHCPVCHAAEPRLVELVASLAGKPFAVAAINPNSGDGLRVDELGYSKYDDSFEHMKLYAKDQGFTFPYLYDGQTQAVAKAYGCVATPMVFIFDKARTLRYRGWLDDSRFADPTTVKSSDAKQAVLALLAGRPVPVPVTKPFGCSTKWLEKKSAVAEDNAKWEKAPVLLADADAAMLQRLRRNDTEKFRLLNVWATTCGPCVAEFPGLIAVSRRMGLRNFELVTVSADLPEDRAKAQAFLEKQRAALPDGLKASLEKEGRSTNNYLYTGASIGDFIQAIDPEWDGALPHTILLRPGGEPAFRHTGAIGERELLDRILEVMTPFYQP